jgi:hypothetical protein
MKKLLETTITVALLTAVLASCSPAAVEAPQAPTAGMSVTIEAPTADSRASHAIEVGHAQLRILCAHLLCPAEDTMPRKAWKWNSYTCQVKEAIPRTGGRGDRCLGLQPGCPRSSMRSMKGSTLSTLQTRATWSQVNARRMRGWQAIRHWHPA